MVCGRVPVRVLRYACQCCEGQLGLELHFEQPDNDLEQALFDCNQCEYALGKAVLMKWSRKLNNDLRKF